MLIARKSAMIPLIAPLGIGVAYYVSAALSLAYTQGAEGIAVMWPASGLLLAALIVTAAQHWQAYIVCAAIASMGANLGHDIPLKLSLGFTCANMIEPLIAIALLRKLNVPKPRFDDIVDLGRFTAATGLASLTGATFAVMVSQGGLSFFLSWFGTVFLGIMLITPIICITVRFFKSDSRALPERRSAVEIGFWLAAVALTAAITFSQNLYPILFIPPALVLATTYRLNDFGAAVSVLIVAVIATALTGQGSGPIHFVPGGAEAKIFFLQFYLLVQLGCALPLAAILSARLQLSRQLMEMNRLLKQAESAALVGHWRIDLIKRSLFWSDEVFNIHGVPLGNPPALLDGLNAYIRKDRHRIHTLIRHAISCGGNFEFQSTIMRPDGSRRNITSKGQVETRADSSAVAVFGSIQDITAFVERTTKLSRAKREAEDAAQKSLIIANTDVLTGLPNRRHIMEALDLAVVKAHELEQPLSVAVFDIDHFKAVNDQHGHACGDKVLKNVALSAVETGRNSDLIGRIGGEEFIILLPGANSSTAMITAERIRVAIERDSRTGDETVPVTVSIGVAELNPGMTSKALIGLADSALYDAKNDGRNVIRLFR